MRRFSRWMSPARPQPAPVAEWLLVVGYLGMMALLALALPWLWLVLAGWVALNVYFRHAETRRWRARAAERAHEDIGRFARSFLHDESAPFDAWVIRATWDAFAVELEPGGARVPVRADDDLANVFDIDDVEPLATAIAWRAGRSARAWQVAPELLDHVRTVRDLVSLIARQPALAAAA